MKTYKIDVMGIVIDGNKNIPQDPKNKDYARILREVAAGTAEIVKA